MKWLVLAGLTTCSVGCDAPVTRSDAESIAEDMADAHSSRVAGQVEALEARITELEGIAEDAKRQADEAHALAEEACKPYGYQIGCGNGG